MAFPKAFLIALCWVIGTILLYILIERLNKRFRFQSDEGFAGLGRWLYRILFTTVPPVLFLAINLLVRIGEYGIGWMLLALLFEIGLIPFCFYVKAMLQNPERIARKARKKAGNYDAFEEDFYTEYETHREFDGKAPFHYIWEQLGYMAKRQGTSYFFCPRWKRKAYVSEIIENNLDILPPILGWEYYEDKEGGNGFDSILVFRLTDGTEDSSKIYRDSLILFLWLCLISAPKLLLGMILTPFQRIAGALDSSGKTRKKK